MMHWQTLMPSDLKQGLPYMALRDAILTRPTLPEGLVVLFSSAATTHLVEGR